MLSVPKFRELIGVHITRQHRGKMHDLWSLSTSPLCNRLCQARVKIEGMICHSCYAVTLLGIYKALKPLLEHNTEVLTSKVINPAYAPILKPPSGYFRFEPFGDLNNWVQVANYFMIARENPDVKCCLFTKNPWFIQERIDVHGCVKPSNLTIVGSSYYVNKSMADQFRKYWFIDHVFTVYDKDYIAEHSVNITCGGRSCAACGRCYEQHEPEYEIREQLK